MLWKYERVYGTHVSRRRVDEHRIIQIEVMAAHGHTLTDIVRVMNLELSQSAVRRFLANIELCGFARTPAETFALPGPPCILTLAMERRILGFLYDRPTAY